MYSDLIIAFMPGERDACVLREALQVMRKQHILGVNRTLAFFKDQNDKFRLCRSDEAAFEGHGSLAELVAIAQWLFGVGTPPQGDSFDEVFLAAVARTWGNSASALLFLLRRDGLNDTDELRRVLSLFQTRICETTLSAEVEAQLSLLIGMGQKYGRSQHEAGAGGGR